MKSTLDQLREKTIIVADTGDLEAVRRLKPTDVTTNPSLVLASSKDAQSSALIRQACAWAASRKVGVERAARLAARRVSVLLAAEMANIVPGRVSVEADPALAFDRSAAVAEAHTLIEELQSLHVSQDRVLIKIAATLEGLDAVRELQAGGIDCNVTLIFSVAQAVAAAEAGAFLISPFVGRISDWHRQQGLVPNYAGSTGISDQWVIFVHDVLPALRSRKSRTEVMAASFRSAEQILALTACDRLTISPKLLDELQRSTASLPAATGPSDDRDRFAGRTDQMAEALLSAGLERFVEDNAALTAAVIVGPQSSAGAA